MLAKLLVLFTFMFGAMVALLWITVDLAGAVAGGSDWVWYLALGLIAVPTVAFAVALLRSRTRLTIALTVAAGALLGGVLLTYPDSSVACTPVAGESAGGGSQVDGLENGALVDSEDVPEDAQASGSDCK